MSSFSSLYTVWVLTSKVLYLSLFLMEMLFSKSLLSLSSILVSGGEENSTSFTGLPSRLSPGDEAYCSNILFICLTFCLLSKTANPYSELSMQFLR